MRSMIAAASNNRVAKNNVLRCGMRGPMTSACHASAGTCSAINISLDVIYEYRAEGNALSRPNTRRQLSSAAGHGRRPRQTENV